MRYSRRARGFGLALASLLAIGFLLGPGGMSTYAFHTAPIISLNAAGLAVSPSRFLIVNCTGDYLTGAVEVQWVDANGVAHDPAQTAGTGCLNPSVAIAPWTTGFTPPTPPYFPLQNAARFIAGYGYFTQTTSTGTTIWQVDLVGGLTPIYTGIACTAPAYADLLFQTVDSSQSPAATFGPHGTLIITCTTGKIWKLFKYTDQNGNTITTFAEIKDLLTLGIDNIQGPSQAPTGFFPAPGGICVASPTESSGRVFCVKTTLDVVTVGSWPDANGVDFFLAKCTYQPGGTGDAVGGMFYVSTPFNGGSIYRYTPASPSPLPGFVGNAGIVTRAGTNQPNRGLGKLTASGISPFDSHPGNFHRDAASVECGGPATVSLDVSPGQADTNFNQFANGTVAIAIVGSATVPASSIAPNSSTVRCGLTGTEAAAVRWQVKDITGANGNPDGIDDWVGWFERTALGLQNEPSPYHGPLVCTGTYTVGNDPPFGGGG